MPHDNPPIDELSIVEKVAASKESTLDPTGRRYVPVNLLIDAINEIATRKRGRIIHGDAGRLCIIADFLDFVAQEGKTLTPEWIACATKDLRAIAANLMDLD